MLRDGGGSVQPGQPPKALKRDVELTLVMLTHGSDAAVLGFDRLHASPGLPGMDLGVDALVSAVGGLAALRDEEPGQTLPVGCDRGVLRAWRDTGKLLNQGIDTIEFRVTGTAAQAGASLDQSVLGRVEKRLAGAEETEETVEMVEGRLLMGDFKESDGRCRVHPSFGEPVECRFDDEHRQAVLGNLLEFVRVSGQSTVDPSTGRIRRFVVENIERVENRPDDALVSTGQRSFEHCLSLDELARAQGVGPMKDVEALFGTWPGTDDDGFEELVNEMRQSGSGTADPV